MRIPKKSTAFANKFNYEHEQLKSSIFYYVLAKLNGSITESSMKSSKDDCCCAVNLCKTEKNLSAAADDSWTNNTFIKALAHLGSSIACLFHQAIRSISVETSSMAARYIGISIFSPSIVSCELRNGNALRQSISVALGFNS